MDLLAIQQKSLDRALSLYVFLYTTFDRVALVWGAITAKIQPIVFFKMVHFRS